jgi:polar amino acid transport system permease protein
MSLTRFRGFRPALLAGSVLLVFVVAGCSGNTARAGFTFKWDVFFRDLSPFSQGLAGAIYITVIVSVLSQTMGVLLGILAALGKMSKLLPLRVIANFYIWVFRGTPLLVQLAFGFYGLGAAHVWGWSDITLFGFKIAGEIQAGIVILGINEGAYMAEIVRAGILAVDPGQTEAAKSLGMTYRLNMTRIVLPQAARVIIPPLGNEFNNMLKTTSLLFVLGVIETYNHYNIAQGQNFQPFEEFLACALWYLLMTTIWGFVQGRIERRFARGMATGSSAPQPPSWRTRFWGRASHDAGTTGLGGH